MGSKPFIAGGKLTMADAFLFAFVDFFAGIGQPLDPECKNRPPGTGARRPDRALPPDPDPNRGYLVDEQQMCAVHRRPVQPRILGAEFVWHPA
jgi:hypothetical protein